MSTPLSEMTNAEILAVVRPNDNPWVVNLARRLRQAEADLREATAMPDDMSHMRQIDDLIADMQGISKRFGNTCVYIRRGGLSWGAVALNREADDKKHGVFDLQAQHDRDMIQRGEQIQRLIADRDEQRKRAEKAEADLRTVREERDAFSRALLVTSGSYEWAWDDETKRTVAAAARKRIQGGE